MLQAGLRSSLSGTHLALIFMIMSVLMWILIQAMQLLDINLTLTQRDQPFGFPQMTVTFDTMLEKAKSKIAHAHSCPVVLKIHNLVCIVCFIITVIFLTYNLADKQIGRAHV